jgi:hypothetical protein
MRYFIDINFNGGKWMTNMFRHADLTSAVAQAERLMSGGKLHSVRVVTFTGMIEWQS